MATAPRPFLALREFLISTLFWLVFGWLHGTQVYLGIRAEVRSPNFVYSRFLLYQMGGWLIWVLLTPFVLWMSRRVPIAFRPRPILTHVLVSLPFPLLHALAIWIVEILVQPWGPQRPRPFLTEYLGTLSSTVHIDILIYWAIVGVAHAFDSRERLRERELHASRVEAQLAQAQLTNLHLQLQPHFLFNTLHTVAGLVRDGHYDSAVTIIAGLSELLRYSLDNAGRNLVPLSEELEVVQRYLAIQQARFPDRLKIVIDVADDTRDAAVPMLFLQPLVENAMRHGIAQSADAGTVEVRTHHRGGSLVVEVINDGSPLAPDWREHQGIGLTSTRRRLAQLYGEEGSVELENQHPGVVARVTIPFSRELSDV
jgi:two-component system LytT family sensor kinase